MLNMQKGHLQNCVESGKERVGVRIRKASQEPTAVVVQTPENESPNQGKNGAEAGSGWI